MDRRGIPLVLGAVAVCVVGAIWFIVARGYLAGAVLFAYLVPAVALVTGLMYRKWHRDVLSLDNIQKEQVASQGATARISAFTGQIFSELQYALAWPATAYLLIRSFLPILKNLSERKLLRREHLAATMELTEGAQFYGPVCMVCLTAVWFLIVNTGRVHSVYAIAFMYLLAASVMVRHMASFWMPSGVAAGFKQAEGNPLAKFAVVLVSDVTTLVLAFASIRSARLGTLVGASGLVRTAKGLVSLGDTLPQMMQGGPAAVVHQVTVLTRTERFVLAAGLLLYLVLIKTAKNGLSQFKRDDADYIAIARSSTAKGMYEKALEQLGKVKHFTTESEEVRIVPLLARSNVSKAKQCARTMLEMNPAFSDDVTTDDVYWELMTRGGILPPEFRLKLWQAALADSVSGSVLMLVVSSWADEPALLRSIFDGPGHPLQAISFAHFLLDLNEPADALECLGETLPAGVEDQIAYLSLSLIAPVKMQEDEEAKRELVSRWFDAAGETYERECGKMSGSTIWRPFLVVTMGSLVSNELAPFAPTGSAWFKAIRDAARDRLQATENGMTVWRLYCAGGGETVRYGDRVKTAR